jgi:hypothetical protein
MVEVIRDVGEEMRNVLNPANFDYISLPNPAAFACNGSTVITIFTSNCADVWERTHWFTGHID